MTVILYDRHIRPVFFGPKLFYGLVFWSKIIDVAVLWSRIIEVPVGYFNATVKRYRDYNLGLDK